MEEICRGAAVLVEPANTPALAGEVVGLLQNRGRMEEMRREGRRVYEQNYTVDKFIERQAEYFEIIAQSRKDAKGKGMIQDQ